MTLSSIHLRLQNLESIVNKLLEKDNDVHQTDMPFNEEKKEQTNKEGDLINKGCQFLDKEEYTKKHEEIIKYLLMSASREGKLNKKT